jgi:hypothetical protein
MTRLGFTAFCLAIVTLVGCSQTPTDAAKPAAEKAGTVQSQSPASSPYSGSGDHGGDGGGGGY